MTPTVRTIVSETSSFTSFSAAARRPGLTAAVIAAADLLCLTFAWIVSLLLSRAAGHSIPPQTWLRSFSVVLITLAIFAVSDLCPAIGMDVLEETKRIVLCISIVPLISICNSWIGETRVDLLRTVVFWFLSTITVLLARSFVKERLSRTEWWGEHVLLIGSGKSLTEISDLLIRHPRLGLHVTGVLSEDGRTHIGELGLPVIHDLETGLMFARQQKINTGIVVLESGPAALSVSEATDRYGIYFPKLIVVPPTSPRFNLNSRAGTLGGHLSIRVSQKLLVPAFRMQKRCLDLSIALIGGVVLLPLMLVIAAAIKLTSPSPIFFGHRRIGRDHVPFRAWKFRTMVSNADTLLAERLARDPALRMEWERDRKLRNDPRVTAIGAVLRKYSLDEIPQLWNVIRSEMSIVGPRPICSAEIPNYAEYFADYAKALPGITGLWQISGRNETTYQERVRFDTYYVNNWSISLDLYIIAMTFKAVFSTRGAY